MMKRLLAVLTLMALGMCLSVCGGGDNRSQEPTSTIPPTPIVATVPQPTETPVATVESKYDEAWARKQVEPLLEETYEIFLAQDWNKVYDLYPDEAKVGCSRTAFATTMTEGWLLATAFGADEILKAALQDLKDGVTPMTFSEITPERITDTATEGEPTTYFHEKGRWLVATPLGQDCASLDTDMGE